MGSLAGIYYGIESIPKEWIDKLQKKDYLLSLAVKFEYLCKKCKKVIIRLIEYIELSCKW
jgi:hypothetical protein